MDGTPDGLGSCDFVLANMEVVIRKEMKEFAPEAYSLLSRLKLTKTDIEYVMNQHLKLSSTTMAKQSESDPDLVVHAAAEMWVKNHPSVWKSWISGCIDPEATNYNKNVDPEQGNGDKCLCKNGYINSDQKYGAEVCKLKNSLKMPTNFQVSVTLHEDSGGLERALRCRENSTLCGCPLPVERQEDLFTLFWDFDIGNEKSKPDEKPDEFLICKCTLTQLSNTLHRYIIIY